MQILAISGSLRANSANSAVLRAAARLEPPGMDIALYDGLATLLPFNPDLDTETPPTPILSLCHRIGASDGLLICGPEYARGVAGALKNPLDWLVGSLEFPEKLVALINISQRATHAEAQLRFIPATMSARLVEPASITIPIPGGGLDTAGIVSDPDLSARLRAALECLAQAIAAVPRTA